MAVGNSALQGVLGLIGVAVIVWLKFVRPIRGDIAWNRQTKRMEKIKARRLARERAKADLGPK